MGRIRLMKQLITPNWRAHKRTISSLIEGGWSDEQRKRKLLLFIERFGGTEIEGASSLYNRWVREETPRAVKKKETGKALKAVLAKQTHQSKDGKQRARQAKNTPVDKAMQIKIDEMIKARWKRFSIGE